LQVSQQSSQITELEAELATARNAAAEVNALASSREHQEIESLRLQVSQLTDQLKHLEMQVSSSITAAAEAKALANDERVRADGIESSCRISSEALTARALAAESDAINAQERANSNSARVVELEESCKELSDAFTDLNDKLAMSSNELKAARVQLEDDKSRAAADFDRITVELERVQRESDSIISGLKRELASAAKENDVLRFNVQELQSQLDVVTQHRASVVHKVAESSAHAGQFKLRATELEAQLSTAQSQIASAEHDAARADAIIAEPSHSCQ
jgi:chromosome segregation ATPase